MTNQSSPGWPEPNIVPIPYLPKLLDPVFVDAHRLVDQIRRGSLIELIPLLRRAALNGLGDPGLPEPVEKKILSSATRMEPPVPGSLAASGPGREV